MLPYKLNLFCRECGLLFPNKEDLNAHFKTIHYGFRQKPPCITQKEFEKISTWSIGRQVHSCPVCYVHYRMLVDLINHIRESHPVRVQTTPTAHTSHKVLNAWANTILHHFGETTGSMILDNIQHRTCPDCSQVFPSFEKCVMHVLTIHHTNPKEESETFKNWSKYLDLVLPGCLNKIVEKVFNPNNQALYRQQLAK